MDILSKDTLELLRHENLRKAVEALLDPAASESSVTITVDDDDDTSTGEPHGSERITIRRLSV